jgi:hypothetical protein
VRHVGHRRPHAPPAGAAAAGGVAAGGPEDILVLRVT